MKYIAATNSKSLGDAPDGVYVGTWSGYVVRFAADGTEYEARTDRGIRGQKTVRVMVWLGVVMVDDCNPIDCNPIDSTASDTTIENFRSANWRQQKIAELVATDPLVRNAYQTVALMDLTDAESMHEAVLILLAGIDRRCPRCRR